MREQFVRKGMLADVAIHAPDAEGDERNYHAHILLTMREIGADGFGAKVREWNSGEQLEDWREAWERTANRYLEKHGHEARIDRRTLEAQGIDREPTVHRGPNVDAMERDGIETEHGETARGVERRNVTRTELVHDLVAVQSEIRALERLGAEELSEPIADIRLAYALSDSASAFREALAERGFWLARADARDVEYSRFEHGQAESKGRYSPVLERGQYVAVDTLGRAFSLGYGATGDSRAEVAAFLTSLDGEALPSVESTRAEFRAPEIDRQLDRPSHEAYSVHEPDPGAGEISKAGAALVGAVVDVAAEATEKLFDGIATAFESLIIGATTPPKPKPRARAPERKPDLRRYLADEDYRRTLAQCEIEERQTRERDYYSKQKEREL